MRNLGKRYELGGRENYRALRDVLANGARRLLPGGHAIDSWREHVWALRDVSFDIAPGEIVGVIGHNGAGKSTLLRLLSRITHPTIGAIRFRGRIGSLLEVGTGFHPELTGGENIYLSGAILGMTRLEIEERFDEIVAFAEIEAFVDTPVKRFSTGMYMRLAFAVAAHLDTDILLVDEVLAVGDARFQQRSIGALERAAFERGRTVLLVSHNMMTIEKLCNRALLIDRGELVMDGHPSEAVDRYLSDIPTASRPDTWIDLSDLQRSGNGEARFTGLRYQADGDRAYPEPGSGLIVDVRIETQQAMTANHLELSVVDRREMRLIRIDTADAGEYVALKPGSNTYRFRFDSLNLNPGQYFVELRLARRRTSVVDHVRQAVEFDVHGIAGIQANAQPADAGYVWSPGSIRRIESPD